MTLNIKNAIGYKIFLMFAAINIGAMLPFSMYVPFPFLTSFPHLLPPNTNSTLLRPHRAIPETKGRSLEEMDVIFGAVSAEERNAKIRETEKGMYTFLAYILYTHT